MKNVTAISIDGKHLHNFLRLKLNEVINDHSRFAIDVDISELEARGSHTLDNSKDLLGKTLVIAFGINSATEFLGIIDDISLKNRQGHEGVIRLKGASKTLKLNGLPSNKSWLNKSLQNIVKDVIEESDIEAQIQPEYKGNLEYTVKYEESNWDFIKRLAKTFGENLEYDGVKLNFGKTTLESPIELQYGRELSNISVGVKARPANHGVFSYNSSQDSKNESKAKNNVEGLNELSMSAFDNSLQLYKNEANTYAQTRTQDKSEVEAYIANKQAAAVADLHVLQADCNVQGLKLGSVINVKSALNFGNLKGFDIKNYGEYKIIDIKHKATGEGVYNCSFKAIPSGITVLPEPKVALPKSNAQVGIVISNEDPKGMGRVKVQMNWQKHQDTTSWIRILMPDAGASDNHSQNRGHVFIPEAGDQVMVGFRHSDPQRPYILGSLFNGNTGAGGGENNKKKSIITRSGNEVIFNDDDGKGSIKVNAPSGNSIHLNGDGSLNAFDSSGNEIFMDANGNTTVTAPETMTLNAKNMQINVQENMEVSIGNDKIEAIGKDHTYQSENTFKTIATNKEEIIGEAYRQSSGEADIQTQTGDLKMKGASLAVLQGGQDVKVSKG